MQVGVEGGVVQKLIVGKAKMVWAPNGTLARFLGICQQNLLEVNVAPLMKEVARES